MPNLIIVVLHLLNLSTTMSLFPEARRQFGFTRRGEAEALLTPDDIPPLNIAEVVAACRCGPPQALEKLAIRCCMGLIFARVQTKHMTSYSRALEITGCDSIETTLRTKILLWAGTLI